MLCAGFRKGRGGGREGGEKRKEKKGREGGEKKKRREGREEGKERDRRKRGREGGDSSSFHTYRHTRIAVTFESWSAHWSLRPLGTLGEFQHRRYHEPKP